MDGTSTDGINLQVADTDESVCDDFESYDDDVRNLTDFEDDDSSFDLQEEEVEDKDERVRQEVKNDLAKWAIDCAIPRTHINKLLGILKKVRRVGPFTKRLSFFVENCSKH